MTQPANKYYRQGEIISVRQSGKGKIVSFPGSRYIKLVGNDMSDDFAINTARKLLKTIYSGYTPK